jgi:lipopolysaccharide biosynthesis protein
MSILSRLKRVRLLGKVARIRAGLRRRAQHAVLAVRPPPFSGGSGSPADFAAWIERGRGLHSGGYPAAWSSRADLPIARPTRVAVVVHVFYPELLEEIVRQLAAMSVAFDLIVTNASGSSIEIDGSRLPLASTILILDVENRGRDLWPLAQLLNAGFLDPYQLILKVHTKRSDWREGHELPGSGESWRARLLESLLGTPSNVEAVLSAFASSPGLGIVTADGSVLGPDFWGDNEVVTANLLRRLELELEPDSLSFAAGSMYWVRGFVLQGLQALGLSAADFEDEAGQVNATTAHALERLIGIVTREAGLSVVERSSLPVHRAGDTAWRRFEPGAELAPRIRVVPFYLPQFHTIPENDRWWGTGFTEWTNVVAAKPMFLGHHQPMLPTTTGFYDLRHPETMELQASLAEDASIAGMMYYHYWFAGHELLETPIRSRLNDGVPLPFCLMWANENWTRRWDGSTNEVLIGQRYDEVPSSRFILDVLPILRDPRYMRIDGRAIIAIYRPGQIPGLADMIGQWREVARREGVGELLVLNVDVAKEFHGLEGDLASSGLDGSLGFPPHNARWEWLPYQHVGAAPGFAGNILSYQAMVDDSIERLAAGVPAEYFPGVMVNFDNTARRQWRPDVWFGANPYTFRRWLSAAAEAVAEREFERRLVFVNAWNEWAESAVLEPSDRFGPTMLLAVRDVAYG